MLSALLFFRAPQAPFSLCCFHAACKRKSSGQGKTQRHSQGRENENCKNAEAEERSEVRLF